MLLTANLFPLLCFSIASVLNTIAIAYHSLAAVPFGSIVVVLLIWMFLSFPLCLFGTVRSPPPLRVCCSDVCLSSSTPCVSSKCTGRYAPPCSTFPAKACCFDVCCSVTLFFLSTSRSTGHAAFACAPLAHSPSVRVCCSDVCLCRSTSCVSYAHKDSQDRRLLALPVRHGVAPGHANFLQESPAIFLLLPHFSALRRCDALGTITAM